MTPVEAVHLLALVKALRPAQGILDGTAEAWHALLGDMPYDAAQRAVLAIARRTSAWIDPAMIRREALAQAGHGPADLDEVLPAITAVARAEGIGRRALPEPAAALYDALGGAPAIRAMPPGVLQARARDTWDAITRRHVDQLMDAPWADLPRAVDQRAALGAATTRATTPLHAVPDPGPAPDWARRLEATP